MINDGLPVYKNESLTFEERARDLVARMTLEEKVSQMTHDAPAIPRLGIPSYNWWNEALHGVARAGVATVFPQSIGMAASFDENLVYRAADIISTEARAKFNEFQRKGDRDIYKGLTFWSPNVNIFRDPRWGRGQETYGEDPFLSRKMGSAFVRGIQGEDKKYLKAAACAKHYAVHSGPEEGRHSFNAVVSEKDLYETYLPAFESCVKDAEAESVMCAYNRVNGEPCCGSKKMLADILRGKWGFGGHVVSDCGALKDFHLNHKVTRTSEESAASAVQNGCDLNCGKVFPSLLSACRKGLVSRKTIDKAVFRLMMTRFKLGLFDSPGKVAYQRIPFEKNDCEEHRQFALEAAKRTLVLLKNDNSLLPLDRNSLKSIAVIGPNADSRQALKGNYFGTASEYITVLEGIRKNVKKHTRVFYAEGCHLCMEKNIKQARPGDRLAEAVSAAERADAVVLCLGLDSTLEGEQGTVTDEYGGGDREDLELPGLQGELLRLVSKTGKPLIVVLFSGGALSVEPAGEGRAAVIQAWYPGAQGGEAVASLIFGDFSPSARLPVTFYRSAGELPPFCDYSMKNRTYRYMESEALYPFGHGLSFTKFHYSGLKMEKSTITAGENAECRVKVKNAGGRDSHEIVQLYIRDVETSAVAPRWQLRGIRSLYIMKGEEKEVRFTIRPEDMALIDNLGRAVVEPGIFEVYAGGSQPCERSRMLTGARVLKGQFEVKGGYSFEKEPRPEFPEGENNRGGGDIHPSLSSK